jgi:hypothetical protein
MESWAEPATLVQPDTGSDQGTVPVYIPMCNEGFGELEGLYV